MSRTIVGLDITPTGLHAVALRSALRSKAVASWAQVPLQGDWHEALDPAIDRLIEALAIKEAVWVGALPGDWISLRNLRVPFGEAKKIRQILPYEMEPLVAWPIDEMVVDFHQAGPTGSRGADILAAAARVAPIGQCLELLARRGIKPAWMTAGQLALPCCLAAMVKGAENGLCVQVGAGRADVAVLVGGHPAIVHGVGLPAGEIGEPAVVKAWLAQAMFMVEAFGLGRFTPESVWIASDGAASIDTQTLAADIDPIPVKTVDLMRDVEPLKLEPDGRDWHGGFLDKALALALIEAFGIGRIDFCRGPLAPKRLWEAHRRRIAVTASAAALVAGLGLSGAVLDYTQKKARVQATDGQLAALFNTAFADGTKMVDPVRQTKTRIAELTKQARFAENREGAHPVLDILADISTGIADNLDVAVNRLEIGADGVTLSGDTATFDTVDEIKQKLQAAASFKEVTIASTNKDKTGNRVQFKLQIQLR